MEDLFVVLSLAVVFGYPTVFVAALLWNATAGLFRTDRRTRCQAEQALSDGPPPRIVVTLVHGTFARNAAWLRSDSRLCEAIRNAFAGEPLKFVPFRWSGRNSVSARHDGGARLVQSIQASVAQWPQARQIVIAHSHGGAVALSALRNESVNHAVLGVVCLSTPFLVAQLRPVSVMTRIGISWTPALILSLILFLATEMSISSLGLKPWLMQHDWLDALLWMTLLMVITVFIMVLFQAPRWIRSRAAMVLARMQLADIEPERLLIIRAPGDEASAALGAVQIVNFVVSRLWDGTSDWLVGLVRNTKERTDQWRDALEDHRALHVGLSLAAFILAVWLLGSSFHVPGGRQVGLLVAFCAGASWWQHFVKNNGFRWLFPIMGLVGRFLLAIVAAPLPVLLALLAMPFGPELAIASLVLNVSAEATPPGRHQVWQLRAPQARLDPGAEAPAAPSVAGLAHSVAYNDPAGLALIAQWMGQRMRGGGGARGDGS